MEARSPQPWPWASAVMQRKPEYGRPTVPGTPGKASPDAKRTEAGGLGTCDAGIVERKD